MFSRISFRWPGRAAAVIGGMRRARGLLPQLQGGVREHLQMLEVGEEINAVEQGRGGGREGWRDDEQ